jgi:hypothetical protein
MLGENYKLLSLLLCSLIIHKPFPMPHYISCSVDKESLRKGRNKYRQAGVKFLAGAGKFSLLHRVQTGSGSHPASYAMGTRGPFPGGKAAGREADHSPSPSAEVKE